jgi:hypothetical protein
MLRGELLELCGQSRASFATYARKAKLNWCSGCWRRSSLVAWWFCIIDSSGGRKSNDFVSPPDPDKPDR